MMGAAYERGMVLYRQKRYAMAAEEFRKELAVAANNASAMAMLAMSLNFSGKPKEALEQAKLAVAANPQGGFCHYALAFIMIGKAPARMRTGSLFGGTAKYQRRLKKSKAQLFEAILLEPQNPDFIALLSALELDLQRPKQALRWADKGLAAKADHIYCADLRAKALTRLDRLDEARQTLAGALLIDPESAAIHSTSGWTSLAAGDTRTALEHFNQTVRLNPNDQRSIEGLEKARRANHPLLRPFARARFAASRKLRLLQIVWIMLFAGSLAQLATSPGFSDTGILTVAGIAAVGAVILTSRNLKDWWRERRGKS